MTQPTHSVDRVLEPLREVGIGEYRVLVAAQELADMALAHGRLVQPDTIASRELAEQAALVRARIREYYGRVPPPGRPYRSRLAALGSIAIVSLAIGVILGSLAALLAFAVLALRP